MYADEERRIADVERRLRNVEHEATMAKRLALAAFLMALFLTSGLAYVMLHLRG